MEKKPSKVNEEYNSNFSIDNFLSRDLKTPQQAQDKRTEVTQPSMQSLTDKPNDDIVPDKSIRKTVSSKQRKSSLEEYRAEFLQVPKITDRKNVFISNSVREQVVEIVRKLGGEKTSVSGFIENLVLNHLEMYHEEIESWKKL